MTDDNTTTIQFGELVHRIDPSPEVKPAYRFSNGRLFLEPDSAPVPEEE